MRTRRASKEQAEEVVRLLTESAVSLSHTDLPMAKQQAALARRVKLRFNVRLGPSHNRFTCKGCKSLIIPGVNARVRLGHGRPTVLRITCSECGHVTRKIVGRAYIRTDGARISDS